MLEFGASILCSVVSTLNHLHLATDSYWVIPCERQLGLIVHLDGLMLRSAWANRGASLENANLSKYLVGPTCSHV